MNNITNPNGPYGQENGIQLLSAATCKISLFRDEVRLSTASGFLTENSEAWFLVTALHNFTGRNFFSRQCISPKLAIPNKFRATVWRKQKAGNLDRFEFRGDLFSNGKPIFLYDWSDEGGDIAVIQIPKEHKDISFVTINNTTSKAWSQFAGLDVFVLGYPSSLDVNGTPIWKKAAIASEPSQKVNGRRTTLLDGLTYSGMSGGPVIISQSHGFTDDKKYEIGKELAARIIGVYGGRYDADGEKSGTLGFYWPMEMINAIIDGELQVGALGDE